MSIVSTHYVQQALAALRSNDPIEVVTARILFLAREANTVPGDPTQLEGLALFQFHLLHRALDPSMQRSPTRDRIVYVFKAFTQQPEEIWLAFMSAYMAPCSTFRTFVHATARFNLDENIQQDPILDISSEAAQKILCGDQPDPSDKHALMCAISRTRWLDFNRLLADLWREAGDVEEMGFAFFGLERMRNALEFDPAVPESQSDVEVLGPRDLLIETASVWVTSAGEQMYRSRQKWDGKEYDEADSLILGRGGARWSGANGYCPGRWSLWRQVFTEIANDSRRRQHVVTASNMALAKMQRLA